ncbi:hypothetical protein GALMADRAFT_899912 [Galerina marginata CBS 339.88]|uniref:Uncharacterized protein n=1 Tax=Galerina marginata (strain CBS 339.88) TaxID=685588 RepID=A0A067SGD2_GALM3|nr:hypothetical protein GALMADRAFT_899912 [Galerina marginata CBS 339.88]
MDGPLRSTTVLTDRGLSLSVPWSCLPSHAAAPCCFQLSVISTTCRPTLDNNQRRPPAPPPMKLARKIPTTCAGRPSTLIQTHPAPCNRRSLPAS